MTQADNQMPNARTEDAAVSLDSRAWLSQGPRLLSCDSELIGGKRLGRQFRRLGDAWALLKDSLFIQIYYGIGLALRKGLPILLIPVLIHYYGATTYAGYVLFYSSIQIFTVLCCLAIPESAIVFWYRVPSKTTLIATYLCLIAAGLLTLGAISSIPLYYIYATSLKDFSATTLTLLALAFIALNGTNTFLLGVYRATDDSKRFLIAQILAGMAWISAAILLARTGNLPILISAFLLSLLIQDTYLVFGLRSYLRGAHSRNLSGQLAREALSFSTPLVIYVASTLIAFWIDKYMVSLYFSAAIFSTFAITFQYAFAQAFFSQFFTLYSFPLICRKVTSNDSDGLRNVLWTYNALMVICGLLYVGALLTVNRYFFPLRIDVFGFLILGSAFLLSNVSGNYVNVMYAHKRSRLLTSMQVAGTCAMALVLTAGCLTHSVRLCYSSELVMWAGLLIAYVYVTFAISRDHPVAVAQARTQQGI